MVEQIQQLLYQVQKQGSRSTIISPLGWLLATILASLVIGVQFAAPTWLLILLGSMASLTFVWYLAAYTYFGFKSPDRLRSEKYTLTKMAIEHSAKGDNVVGLIGVNDLPRLPPPSTDDGG